jgi:deoxyribodipyrimidine photo-lyase
VSPVPVPVPSIRIRTANARSIDPRGDFVLYWMIASRRARHNFALDRAIEHARALGKPLLVLEPLRVGYRFACDRFHRFVLQGMADNAARFEGTGILHHPYVEPAEGAGKGLLAALAARAAVVITDDYPAFFLPRMIKAAAAQIPVLLEIVDSIGLVPMRATDRPYTTAYSFRFFLQKNLKEHIAHRPSADPLKNLDIPRLAALPSGIGERWPRASTALLAGDAAALAALPIDHSVPVSHLVGGAAAAEARLREFLKSGLPLYAAERNDPDVDAASGLSPYLHFGHISAHEVFTALMKRDGWRPEKISGVVTGQREGWWGASPEAESFLDELVTWRELGLVMCSHREDYMSYDSLPDWALKTLAKHESDTRPILYTMAQLEAAKTHDPIWNAAQRQLVSEGRMHNYLRMLWGKKVLEWSTTPREAVERLIVLNDKYALDGRDPNSYSGIFWVFGRYDRAWGPERPIFGTIRYMSSDSTAKKLKLKGYLARYSGAKAQLSLLGAGK